MGQRYFEGDLLVLESVDLRVQVLDLAAQGVVLHFPQQVLSHFLHCLPQQLFLQSRNLLVALLQRHSLLLALRLELLQVGGGEEAVGATLGGLLLVPEEFALDDHQVFLLDHLARRGLDLVDECGEVLRP